MLPYSLPVHYTCRNKQMPLDIIKFLLFHQPNLAHKVDMEGRLQLQLNLHSLFVYDWLHYVFERKHESLEILNFLLQNFQKGIDCTCQMSMDTFHCMRRAVGIQLISSASNDWYKPMSIVYYSGHLMEILPYICLLATKHTNTSSRATSFCT